DGGCFLANSNVDTTYLFIRIPGFPVGFLVQNRIDTDCGFTSLAVTNDELALPTTDRNHRVDGFHTGLEWFVYCFWVGCRWSWEFQRTTTFVLDVPEVVHGLTNWVDHTTHKGVTDWYRQYFAGAIHFRAFMAILEVPQYNDTNFSWVEVLGKPGDAVFKTQQFVCHNGR